MLTCPTSITGMRISEDAEMESTSSVAVYDKQQEQENKMNQAGAINLTQASSQSSHQRIFLLTLLGLLVLRIPFLAGLTFFNVQWKWVDTVFQIGTYLLTTFLIWWELENLVEYHIDTLAVMIIILFKPVQTLLAMFWKLDKYQLAFPTTPALLIWLIAIVFAVGIWWKRSRLPRVKPITIGWLFIGILAGLFAAICLSFPYSIQISSSIEFSFVSYGNSISIKDAARDVLRGIPLSFLYQTGFAAVAEEPLFRGFLWGYLRKLKWHELWIWLFQTSLFMLGHIYYLHSSLLSFWIAVPVGGLILGWLAWRSRTTASSMMAHGVLNATAASFGYLLAIYRLG